MPVEVVDDFTCELPDAPRGSEAPRNSALRAEISKSLERKFRTRARDGMQRSE